jgi:hypothetical protein
MIETVSVPLRGRVYSFRVPVYGQLEPSRGWVSQQGIAAVCEIEVLSMDEIITHMYFVRYEDAFSYVMKFG